MDFQKALGVKSFCFRQFTDPSTLASMVRDCGVDKLDISRCHVDFASEAAQETLLKILGDAGITIVGLGVVKINGEESNDRPYFEFCRRAGCRTISIDFSPPTQQAALASAAKLCAEYGMRCAIHNHGGRHWLGNRAMVQHLLSNSPESLGLCLDTAWAIDAGEDPVTWAQAAGPRLMATHLKDFVFDPKGKPTDTLLGEGALDLPAYLSQLRTMDFDGPFVIEYEGDENNPVPALRQCVEIVRRVLDQLAPQAEAAAKA